MQRLYGETMHEAFPKLFAHFPPNEPVAIGDFGIVNDSIFGRLGSVEEQFDLTVGKIIPGNGQAHWHFTSQGNVTVEAIAGIEGVHAPARSKIVVNFSHKNGVFFNAADCETLVVDQQVSLGAKLLQLFAERRWRPEWSIVVGTLTSPASTILISSHAGARAELESDTGLTMPDLAHAHLGLRAGATDGMGLQLVGTYGTPLLYLAQVRRKPLGGLVFQEHKLAPDQKAQAENALRDRLVAAGEGLENEFELAAIEGDDLWI